MEKKKQMIIMFIAMILLIGFVIGGFLIVRNKGNNKNNDIKEEFDNKVVSTITLDINPSIKIELNKDKKVVNIVSLNDDGKEIIEGNYVGRELKEVVNGITDKLIDKGYAKEELVILVGVSGEVKGEDVKVIIGNKLDSNTAFTVELDELINLESLSINLTFKDNKTNKITFNLGIYNELNYAWNIEPNIIQINTNYNDNLNLNFLNQNKYQELLNNLNSSNLNNNISYSIVTEKLYRLYEPVKVYLSNYTEKPLPNCIHDLNDYKKYYTYYERYYIEIKDDVTSCENIILNTNIPLNEIEVITKEDFIILKYKHDTFYKKINKPKEENNLKNIVKVVNKQPTTKKNNYIPSTTKEVITTTKNTIQDQPKEKHISYIYLLLIPILIILYIFIRKNKI